MTEFIVEGITLYDGLEFPWQWRGTAEDEAGAKAEAIYAQLRGGPDLEWKGKDGEAKRIRNEDDLPFEIAFDSFRAQYLGEDRVIDWSFNGMAIHEIYCVREAPLMIPAAKIAAIVTTLKDHVRGQTGVKDSVLAATMILCSVPALKEASKTFDQITFTLPPHCRGKIVFAPPETYRDRWWEILEEIPLIPTDASRSISYVSESESEISFYLCLVGSQPTMNLHTEVQAAILSLLADDLLADGSE
jgi:hypothetical protein